MRLTENNIRFVKESVCNGVTYSWFVAVKEGGDCQYFINYKDGKTVVEDYPLECLPKSVQKFVNKRIPELFSHLECAEDKIYSTYIYR